MGELRRRAPALALIAVGLVVSLVDTAPASAAHGDSATYFDPEAEVDGPQSLTEGPDGNLWFTSPLNDRVGHLDPDAADPAASIVTFDAELDVPWDITSGPDGNLWFTGDTAIGRITPAGDVTTFPHADIDGGHDIVAFGDQLWFTATDSARIGRITTAGVITTDADPGLQGPTGITVGPFLHVTPISRTEVRVEVEDVIWFADTGAGQVGWIGPGDSTFHYLDAGGVDAPADIVFDPEAHNDGYGMLWVNDSTGGQEALCRADSLRLATRCESSASGLSELGPIDPGHQGDGRPRHPWRTDLTDDSVVTRDAATGDPLAFTLDGADGITDLLTTANGDLWFASQGNDGVGWIDLDGEPPALTLTGLEDGDEFLRTEQPTLTYTCEDPAGGSGMADCGASYDGSFASGQELPDNGIGARHVLVHAVDTWGNSAQVRLDFSVLPTSSCAGRPATAELAFGDHPSDGDGEPYVVVGTPGNDRLRLSSNRFIVCTGAGADRIEDGGRIDLHLGAGTDVVVGNWSGRVFGGPGDDRITSEWWLGTIAVRGGAGSDIVRTAGTSDDLDGGPGDDQLVGGDGNDTLTGGLGRDRLDGGPSGDTLAGGAGHDVVSGGRGRDICSGGSGVDRQSGCELKFGFP